MSAPVRIALVGNYNPEVTAHRAIPLALEIAGKLLGRNVQPAWLATETLERDPAGQLAGFAGLWCVPGSPYASEQGALNEAGA